MYNNMSTIDLWKKYLCPLYGFVILAVAPFAHAQCANQGANTIPNPINVCSFLDLVKAVANAVIVIATPIAVVAIIFVGFKLVVAAGTGDQSGLQSAKKMLVYVLIGTAIIVGASALAIAVINTIRNVTG